MWNASDSSIMYLVQDYAVILCKLRSVFLLALGYQMHPIL